MQTISSYIAYLLTRHECVILPGFGAFVVSDSERQEERRGELLSPPSKFLGFNPDIRHSDGLLANAVAKGEGISYAEAGRRVCRYIDRIIDETGKQVPVQVPWVGKLELSEERNILFTPAPRLSCNADTFGLDRFYLPSVDELKDADKLLKKEISVRPTFFRRVPAIAAAILALFMIATPLSDYSRRATQTATFFPLPTIFTDVTTIEKPSEAPARIAEEPEMQTPYYIVIASLPTKTSARVQIDRFEKAGLSDLGIVSAGSKHRVYIAKFSDKADANAFLLRFRAEQPRYREAWLLIQRT
jgi:nucleoid DNA-binding protein